jgi:molecular chaperone GrpE
MVKDDDFEDYDDDSETTTKGNGKDNDEIHIEVLDPDGGGSALVRDTGLESSERSDELARELEQVKTEKAEIYDKLLRKAADFDNYRKRTEKEKRENQQYALADFMSELILILDNFERAFAHSDEESNPEYQKGVELIYRQLRDLMEKKGLRPMLSEGKPFDPNIHEAIAREERDDLPDNTVLEELQKGYFFRDKLLRPALVKVSHRQDSADEE